MEKQRKVKILTIIALLFAILGLTVAFAALSQVLQINGTTSVNSDNWDVHIENFRLVEKTGDATFSEPIVENTSLKNFNVSVRKPGDSIKFSFDVKNSGDIDAWLVNAQTDYLITKCMKDSNYSPNCDTLNFNEDAFINSFDFSTIISYISYRVYLTDTDEDLRKVVSSSKNEKRKLMSGNSVNITVEITYKDITSLIDKQAVIIDDTVPITLTYEQYD